MAMATNILCWVQTILYLTVIIGCAVMIACAAIYAGLMRQRYGKTFSLLGDGGVILGFMCVITVFAAELRYPGVLLSVSPTCARAAN